MNTTISEQMSQMSREVDRLRKRVAAQQAILLGMGVILVAAFCMAAASPDGHFDRVFAKSVIVQNSGGDSVAQLSAVDGGGSLLIRDSTGGEAIQIISGEERNDLLIYDRENGRIAVAVQGMAGRGRLSLHRTFDSLEAAEKTLGETPGEYLGGGEGKQVTVPVQRLPEPDR